MYAINVDNKPYVVKPENMKAFRENCKKQAGIADKMGEIFTKEDFQFKRDERGYYSVTLKAREVDG